MTKYLPVSQLVSCKTIKYRKEIRKKEGGGNLMNTKNPMSKALIRRETIAGYAFMAPSLIFFLGFVIYPMIQCVFTSFFDSTMNLEDIFIGFSN